jgi:hypothetical protein
MGQLHKSPRKVRSWFGTLDLLTVANNQCSWIDFYVIIQSESDAF